MQYTIITKPKYNENWEQEEFLTGGKIFNWTDGQRMVRQLRSMCFSFNYKLKNITKQSTR